MIGMVFNFDSIIDIENMQTEDFMEIILLKQGIWSLKMVVFHYGFHCIVYLTKLGFEWFLSESELVSHSSTTFKLTGRGMHYIMSQTFFLLPICKE